MSIIDQICDIEETLIKMRKDSEQKILEINNDFSVKKAKMREHFVPIRKVYNHMAKSNNKTHQERMNKNCHIPDLVQAEKGDI